MKPVRTPETNKVYVLQGAGRESDLPVCRVRAGFVISEWVPTAAERAAIAAGARIELGIYTEPIPPVHLAVVKRTNGSAVYVGD